MVKPGFGIFQGRRKSAGNAIEDADPAAYLNTSPPTESSGFRVLNRADIEKTKQEKAEQQLKVASEKSSRFGRLSGFGALGNKGRTQSIDDDSPSSSKRDSKSSSGTQSFTSRPYHAGHFGGSSSTLPSSAESDLNDNMFSNLPTRPHVAQHSSSPGGLTMGAMKKKLPAIPSTRANDTTGRYYGQSHEESIPSEGRPRAMTTSSYASTAIPPKLEADLSFGAGFEDVFSSLDRKDSPDFTNDSQSAGRSLLAGRRTFQAEPINIDRKLDVEAPPKSWDSRSSGEQLISSPVASPTEDASPPPPVPPHKYGKYVPIASESPELRGSNGFEDEDAKMVRQSVQARKSLHEGSPEHTFNSLQTPLSSNPASNNATPKAALRPAANLPDDDDDNMFAPPKAKDIAMRKSTVAVQKENIPPQPSSQGRRVMTAAEFKMQQQYQMTQPADDSSDGEDYEDEEDAIRKREEEQRALRQRQQMQIAREHMRRSTTAPADLAQADGVAPLSNGFPSETSLQADEWSDEDVPLGVLAQHGFPSKNRPPTQPTNAMPSYFRSSTPTLPDRPASAGALGNRASTYRPPFARGLPDDPHASMIGGGLVRQPMRESMGFNSRGAASVYNEPTGSVAGGMGTMPYNPEPQFTSLVDQIQMRDNAKQKYMGGASSKKPQGGPFTGALSGQMNASQQNNNPTRMSMMGMQGMPGMQGMNGMNGMPGQMNPMMMNMNMMGGNMPMMGMGMGMNQMPYPMYPQNELMMQQMYQQMLQMQAQQNAMFGGNQNQQQQPQFDHRMSMAQPPSNGPGFQAPQFQNNSFLSVNNGAQRPMSIMSVGGAQNQPGGNMNRPFSTLAPGGAGFQGHLTPGYTPSIAPSERSNIGLSARYRPVVTGNGMATDAQSTVSSMTLQASGGAVDTNKKVKGILKNKGPQVTVREDDEDDWGKIAAARKNKFAKANGQQEESAGGLQELVRGVDGY